MSITKVRLPSSSKRKQTGNPLYSTFWHTPTDTLLKDLGTTSQGLSSAEAEARLPQTVANGLSTRHHSSAWRLLLAQFQSPIILILLFATGLSFFVHDHVGAVIILTIVLISGLLGFWQENGAANAVEKLLALVQVTTAVLRDGKKIEVPMAQVVSGDVIVLGAGDSIPGDSLILESKDLNINEASLTGETYPVEKAPAELPAEATLNARSNTLFMGTNVVSGSATAVVVLTGRDTEFGQVSAHLQLKPPETEFESGIRHFGYLLMEVTLFLVIGIFAVNVYLARPVLDSFLFALALAVGLTPQLLPAIISINLAHGARNMAAQKVIVKRLASIENFGSMNVLCSDKTGTLTEGVVTVQGAFDINGADSAKVLLHAFLNASFETGFTNPIDQAIRSFKPLDISGFQKVSESPYDFIRKRLSIVVDNANTRLMVTKGALSNVLDVCSLAESPTGIVDLATARVTIEQQFTQFSNQGFRTLGIAYRSLETSEAAAANQESAMTFLGFIVLADPPKKDIVETIGALRDLGVQLKMITGDNRLVAAHVGQQVGLSNTKVLSGPDLYHVSDEALRQQVSETDIFAEIEPNQKERIILSLQKVGNVVGYMGDGINDASALHAADVGISVSTAVDVAKEAADIVLLEQDLKVLLQGVRGGRETFANTLKYVFMATSANFGNMFSMASASLFLPFLPLLPMQVLLTNLLTDFPEMTIATDAVDAEWLDQPHRWNINFIRKFMVTFGIISSVFDFLTFGILLLLLHAKTIEFRTGWFIENVISASIIVLVIRTKRPFYKSKPGRALMGTTLLIVIVTLILPFTPLGRLFGFSAIPVSFLLSMGIIMVLYISLTEIAKHYFYQRVKF